MPVALLSLQLGCIGRVTYACGEDEQCDLGAGARCIDGLCAAQDETCPSGYRFSEHSPEGAVCTPEEAASGSGGDPPCIVTVEAAGGHVCVLTAAGAVECFGSVTSGVAQTTSRVHASATQLSVGTLHACLVDDGVLCWGSGEGFLDASPEIVLTPIALPGGPGLPREPALVDAGLRSTCVLGSAGVYCMGAIAGGQDDITFDLGGAIVDVEVGREHVCVLDAEGAVRCAGSPERTQLTGLPPGATALVADRDVTCALVQGDLWCWGLGGQYGIDPSPTGMPPVRVGQSFTAFDLAPSTACAVGSDGRVHCSGDYFCDGSSLGDFTPIEAVGPVGDLDPQAVAVGDTFMCLLAGDGTVHCWGTGLGSGACTDLRALDVACPP